MTLFHKKKTSWAKKEKKMNPLLLRIVFDILLLAFFGIAGYIFFFSPYLRINKLVLSGVEELDYEKVLGEINSRIQGKYFNIVPRNNFILIFRKNLENDLLNKFKKIESVGITKEFPDKLEVAINERKALILWCSGGPCYITDSKGYAYAGADLGLPELEENNLIRLVDLSVRPVDLGQKVLEPDYIQFVLGIKRELLDELGLELEDEYSTKSSVAEEVRVKTKEGWDIYFNSKISFNQSVEILKMFLNEKIGTEEHAKLEYIDVRIENKVFYKFKDNENVEENKNPEERSANAKVEIKSSDSKDKKKD